MNKKAKFPTSEQINTLYRLIGEAVCAVQILEDALSHSMAIRKTAPGSKNLEQGDKTLKKYRRLTLGQAIKKAISEDVYTDWLQNELKNFLSERNWLIHKCIPENIDDIEAGIGTDRLFMRIHAVARTANWLQQAVEVDMMNFASTRRDMTQVYVAIEKHYGKNSSK